MSQWTVSTVMPEVAPRVALIVLVPTAALFANPPPLMTATLTFDEVHATWLLTLNDVPSLKEALAVNCCEVPKAMLGLLGVTVTV